MSEQQALTRTENRGDGASTDIAPRETSPHEASPRQNLNSALIPQNFEQLERFSKAVASSQMVPKAFQRRPQDVMVAVMHGLEIGLKPLQALQNIAVINGKPSIYGDAAIALVRQSPVCKYVREWIDGQGDGRIAFCESHRRGEPEPQVRSFSVDDAKQANLWNKRGPWQDYPQRMLQMRARSWLLRDVYADVLAGLYIAEEAMDIPSDEETQGTDYAEGVRTAKNWLRSRRDEDFTDAIRQVREKTAEWPETYRQQVEQAIAAEKTRREGLRLDESEDEVQGEAETGAQPEAEAVDYNREIDRLRAELRAAYGDEGKWNAAVSKWRERLAGWPEKQTERANRAVQETLQACREKAKAEKEAAEKAKTENATKAAEAMQKGETALPKKRQKGEGEGSPAQPLGDDVPMRSALVDAGLTTREAVQRAYAAGELRDVKGIGPKTEAEIARALELSDDVSVVTDDGSELFQ